MPQIFPPEILNYSAESYYSKISTRSRIIYLFVLFFLVSMVVSLPIIKIDVSSQSRGVIRTPFENTMIQSSIYGEVVRFEMYENKSVVAGDTLLILNTERLDEQINLEFQKKSDNEIFIQDIESLINNRKRIISPKYKNEWNRYLSKIREQKIQIDYLKKEYQVAEKLYQKKVISEFEFLQQRNNWEKCAGLLSYLQEEYRASWQNEHTRLELENQSIQSSIRQLEKEKRNYVLTAPTSGTLIQVSGFQNGNFIAPNQTISFISSSDSLLAECYISPADIGYIRQGQKAIFQMDAFNYQEWGMIEGKVIEILNDVVNIADKPMFRVRCKLDSSCLQLKNGYEGHLKKGMTTTARFHLARRSLWQLLFDKVDNWMNPKMIKK